jgi:hypothetical protein
MRGRGYIVIVNNYSLVIVSYSYNFSFAILTLVSVPVSVPVSISVSVVVIVVTFAVVVTDSETYYGFITNNKGLSVLQQRYSSSLVTTITTNITSSYDNN